MPQMCFSYPAPLPPGTGNAPVPSGPRRMPVVPCFDYPADGPRMPARASTTRPTGRAQCRFPASAIRFTFRRALAATSLSLA